MSDWIGDLISLSRKKASGGSNRLASEEDVKRFHAEAEAAANLQHPNIVPIRGMGERDGQHDFSMDYVEGASLAEVVREHSLP